MLEICGHQALKVRGSRFEVRGFRRINRSALNCLLDPTQVVRLHAVTLKFARLFLLLALSFLLMVRSFEQEKAVAVRCGLNANWQPF